MPSINSALCLPLLEVFALAQGRVVVALPGVFISPGKCFAIYPVGIESPDLSEKDSYQAGLWAALESDEFEIFRSETVGQLWAQCEACQVIDSAEPGANQLFEWTAWSRSSFQAMLASPKPIFWTYLRLFRASDRHEVNETKNGKFVALSKSLKVEEKHAILSQEVFVKRCRQIKERSQPDHQAIASIHDTLVATKPETSEAHRFITEIRDFLGWASGSQVPSLETEVTEDWSDLIVLLANRSLETDQKKSNYQAGTDFENIVHKSLSFLGFHLDEAYRGGAGGLDLFCSAPYPMAVECKSGKSIPDQTAEELDRIGKRHLQDRYLEAVRLIIGPGKPTKNLQQSALISKISILHPMSLQKLVKLHQKYPGSINLVELKGKLNFGQSDEAIQAYIAEIWDRLKLRSHVIASVKELERFEQKAFAALEVKTHYNATFARETGVALTDQQMYELLIELSSPLAGHLGREGDRFYFLRDLVLEPLEKAPLEL